MNLLNRPFLTTFALSLLLLSSCDDKNDPTPPLPDTDLYTKDLTLQLFTETDYSDARWENSQMKVNLVLLRRSTALPKDEVLLDTTIGWIPFKQLPPKVNPINVHKVLRNMHRIQDGLRLDVTKVVSLNDYETELSYSQVLDNTKQEEKVEIKL